MKTPIKKQIRAFLGLAAGFGLLYLVLRSTDWAQVGDALSQSKPGWLLTAGAILISQQLVRGWRLMMLSVGFRQKLADYTRAVMIGLGAGNFLPLRVGEVIKIAYIVKRAGVSVVKGTLAVVVERALDVLCLVLLIGLLVIFEHGLVGIWWAQAGPAIVSKAPILTALACIGVILTLILAWMWISNTYAIRDKVRLQFRSLFDTLKEIERTGTRRLSQGTFLSLIIWFMDTLFLICMCQGFNITLPLTKVFFIQVCLAASYASSVSPGAIGIYEFVGVWALKTLGQNEITALAMILATHGMIYLILGLGCVYVLTHAAWLSQPSKTKIQEEVNGT